MSLAVLKGALKSKTVWWNVLLVVLASLEMLNAHLTTLFGAKVAAGVLMTGALINLILRAITTTALRNK